MKTSRKILYYIRLSFFIITLIFVFLNIKNYLKVGITGYIFFIMEFAYIIILLLTILSKRKVYVTDLSFNIMNLGTCVYHSIVTYRMYTYKLTTLVPYSYRFYRNNYIILSILLAILIFFAYVVYVNDEDGVKI